MSSIFDNLVNKQLISDYPSHMKNNVHYECIMGSVAYGVSNDTSDIDVYGFCMPPKHILFPYSSDNIIGFGKKPEVFEQFQKHHIMDKGTGKEYDIAIYNIIKFFQLCMENNPNMIDCLFVPTRCVLHSTAIGNHVKDNRKLFLSKRVWHKFKGYAYSQLHKMKNKIANEWVELCNVHEWDLYISREDAIQYIKENDQLNTAFYHRTLQLISKLDQGGKRTKRLPSIQKNGYDVKFAYHVVRLLDECQMILEEGDLDLTRSREHLKAIRKGEVSIDSVIDYFDQKLITLEDLYAKSDLPYSPDEDVIKQILFECIEDHYGTIDKSSFVGVQSLDINNINNAVDGIIKAQEVLNKALMER